jgi:hypothetical protein
VYTLFGGLKASQILHFIGGVIMEKNTFSLENVLNIIFRTTTKSAQIFADLYLRKDVSIISRWKNNSSTPKIEDFRKIVDFTVNESTAVQRVAMKDEIKRLLNYSSLNEEIKTVIFQKEGFDDFLLETLSASAFANQNDISTTNSIEHYSKDKNQNYLKRQNSTIDIDGVYTGTINFDVVLRRTDEQESVASGKGDIHLNSNLVNSSKKKFGKAKKSILSGTILSIVVLGIASSFFIAQAAYNIPDAQTSKVSQNTVMSEPNNNVKSQSSLPSQKISNADDITAVKVEEATLSPLPSSTPIQSPTPQNKYISENKISKSNNVSYEKKTHSKNNNNNNINSNNTNSHNNTVINNSKNTTSADKSITINGDNNIVVNGNSSISINNR